MLIMTSCCCSSWLLSTHLRSRSAASVVITPQPRLRPNCLETKPNNHRIILPPHRRALPRLLPRVVSRNSSLRRPAHRRRPAPVPAPRVPHQQQHLLRPVRPCQSLAAAEAKAASRTSKHDDRRRSAGAVGLVEVSASVGSLSLVRVVRSVPRMGETHIPATAALSRLSKQLIRSIYPHLGDFLFRRSRVSPPISFSPLSSGVQPSSFPIQSSHHHPHPNNHHHLGSSSGSSSSGSGAGGAGGHPSIGHGSSPVKPSGLAIGSSGEGTDGIDEMAVDDAET